MNNIPQWQLNLLARFPRQLALTLIVMVQWFINDGFIILIMIAWVAIPPFIAWLATQDILTTVCVLGVDLFSGAALVWVIGWFLEKYDALDKKLPVREKKSEDKPS